MRLPYLRTFRPTKFENVAKKISVTILTPGRRQSKTPIISRNVDKKINRNSVFDCHLSETLFLSIFDPHSSIVDNVFDCPSTRCDSH